MMRNTLIIRTGIAAIALLVLTGLAAAETAATQPVRNAGTDETAEAEADRKQADSGLKNALERLRRLREAARRRRQTLSKPEPAAEPVATQPAAPPKEHKPDKPKGDTGIGIDEKTLELLEKAPRKGLSDPVSLADALFRDKRYRAAFIYYEMAAGDEQAEYDFAWLTFQMANCKRKTAPEEAREYYELLFRNHGDSYWAKIAKSQDSVLQWEEKNDPSKLLAELEKQLQSKIKSEDMTASSGAADQKIE
ncbi:MAG: hypothetical protein ACLFVU_15195 [Phycisphaerae bacterium]